MSNVKQPDMTMAKVTPKKDFKCQIGGKVFDLKSGKETEVPKCLLANLKTEKVL